VRAKAASGRVSGGHPGSLLASRLAGDNGGLGWGTTVANAAKTFADLGVQVTKVDSFDPTSAKYNFKWDKPRVRDGQPAPILTGWYQHGKVKPTRNGAHFIVVARIAKNRAVVVLDPLQGPLHEPHGQGHLFEPRSIR